jgi:hypothetical protein
MHSIPTYKPIPKTTLPEQKNGRTDTEIIKLNLSSFLRTEGPYIVGMTKRAGIPGMAATTVVEPKFWSGQWIRRSTEASAEPIGDKNMQKE